jgi:hypothetical protein
MMASHRLGGCRRNIVRISVAAFMYEMPLAFPQELQRCTVPNVPGVAATSTSSAKHFPG